MSTTFQNIYEDVINRLGQKTSDTNLVARIKGYINDNYKAIANKYDWRWLYADTTIRTTAVYKTGTVTVTNGSTTVTGSSTVFTSSMVGRKFKTTGFEETYLISAFVSGTQITLDNEFNGDSDSDASYEIYQDIYSLPSDCDQIVALTQARTPIKIENIGIRELYRQEPSPEVLDTDPIHYAYYKPNVTTGYQQIIIYPPPYRQIVMYLKYKKFITELSSTSDEPLVPEQYRQILKLMTMADNYGHEKDDDRNSYYEMKANLMLSEMKSKFVSVDDTKQFIPENKRRYSTNLQQLANNYHLGDVFSRW